MCHVKYYIVFHSISQVLPLNIANYDDCSLCKNVFVPFHREIPSLLTAGLHNGILIQKGVTAVELHTSVLDFPGVGAARGKALARLGLLTAEDLLAHYPRGYEDRTRLAPIAQAPNDGPVCVAALVAEPPRLSRIRKGLELVKARVVDGTGSMELTFFNQAYVKDALHPGSSYVFYGLVEGSGSRRQMTNPIFEAEGAARFTGRIMPVYPLTASVSNKLLAGLTQRAVESCLHHREDVLPLSLRQSRGLADKPFALANIHFPASWEDLAAARHRLCFEEFFLLSVGLALLRRRRGDAVGRPIPSCPMEDFLPLLPFSPTGAQRRAMEEVSLDMASGRPMNRLVQGDVGSGKTAVAAYAGWLAAKNGCQAALMAPTEILAEQHFRTLTALLAPTGLRVGLLTGSMGAAEKTMVKKALAAGEIDFVVGTHALLTHQVEFSRLALVVADEQHRFGVGQRATLSAKSDLTPHVLVMSATPIPRTLALILYGDLEVTVLDELPPGRTPVATYLVGEDKRQRMLHFLRQQVEEGRQAYIVCPMVAEMEEGSTAELKAATAYAQHLQANVFPDLRVGLIHGRLKAKEKEFVMAAFSAGEIQILVSTTVIEVGVDVPNASVMVIENAERFGLSQLHQLRGRVGRGHHQSHCILVSATRNPDTRARLKALCATTDGFKIAEEDLKLRGPGDFFGARQHGLPQLRVASFVEDIDLLHRAQADAKALLDQDPHLSHPDHRPLLDQVRRLFSDNPDIFN